MTPEPQAHNSQRIVETDCPSVLHDFERHDLHCHLPQNNNNLSAIIGLDTSYSDSNAKSVQQSTGEPQLTAGGMQSCLTKATQPTRSASPPTDAAKASISHPLGSTPKLPFQEIREFNIGGDESKPEVELMQEKETPLRFSQSSATRVMEECALKLVVKSEESISDYSDKSATIPANEHSHPTPPRNSSKSTPERLVIDLTEDDEELPHQPTDHRRVGSSVAKSTSSKPSSSIVQKDQACPKSAELNNKKRKRSDPIGERALVSASKSSIRKHSNDTLPNRQRPQRKTSPGEHLTSEILWMSQSVSKIDKMVKVTEEEIDAIKKKRARLLEENDSEMQSAQTRMNESMDLKEYLLAWGAEDQKVTEEWSSSE